MVERALGMILALLLRPLLFAPLRLAAGAALGRLLGAVGFRASVILNNLEIAFPRETRRRETLRAEAYRHFGRLVVEILLLLGPWRAFIKRNTELRGKENWDRAIGRGRGVIFLANHVGNWEAMAACGSLGGIQVMLVTKHLKPEWLHRAIEAGRAKCGVDATYEPRTFRDVLKRLKNGRTVGFVLDQYAGPPVGVRVPFFGVPVGTQSAVAIVAKRTGAAVLPVWNRRLADGRFLVEIQPEIEWKTDPDPEREVALNTARYAEVVEAHVRACPEQWLWVHRRFKGDLSPLGAEEWSSGRKSPKLVQP